MSDCKKQCENNKKCCGKCNKETEQTTVQENEQTAEQPTVETPVSFEELVAIKDIEIAKLHEDILRAAAEVQNTKRRAEIDIKNRTDYASTDFAKSILPVLDSLNMAISSFKLSPEELQNDNVKNMLNGIEMVEKMFLKSLQDQGIEKIQTEGEDFNPEFHNAVQQMENSEFKSGQIIQELQSGYLFKGKPIKEAMVIVAK